MAAPSNNDIIAPFDPTAYPLLSFAQLYQLVSGLAAYTDKGFVITTTDVAGVPEVPDASTTTKWQRYLWRRITAITTGIYVWDENHTNDATYLKWVSITVAGIAVGSIVNAMIADNTITDIKIANVDWSKILNVPAGFAPSGAAGGDLTGTYPNPSIGANKVTGSQIALATILHANIAAQAVEIPTDIKPSAVGLSLIRTNAGATALEYFVPQLITLLVDPAAAGDQGKVVRVKTPYTDGYELVTPKTIVDAGTTANTYTSADVLVSDAVTALGVVLAPTAHGLGATPTSFSLLLICQSADRGYAAGDIIDASGAWNNQPTFSWGGNATQVFCTLGATTLGITNKGAGPNTGNIDNTKWKIRLIARL